MNYMLFYTGLASTPNTVGLKNLDTGEKIHEITVARDSGKETRLMYNKYMGILKRKYSSLCNLSI
jgi:hypothetical protein